MSDTTCIHTCTINDNTETKEQVQFEIFISFFVMYIAYTAFVLFYTFYIYFVQYMDM